MLSKFKRNRGESMQNKVPDWTDIFVMRQNSFKYTIDTLEKEQNRYNNSRKIKYENTPTYSHFSSTTKIDSSHFSKIKNSRLKSLKIKDEFCKNRSMIEDMIQTGEPVNLKSLIKKRKVGKKQPSMFNQGLQYFKESQMESLRCSLNNY